MWSSGEPTIAPSGGTFLDGAEWGDYDGLLLLGLLRGQGVLALRLDAEGGLVEQFRIPSSTGSTVGSAPSARAVTEPSTSPPTTAATTAC